MIVNCDMGEGLDNDALLMPYIGAANIATGYHAGDTGTITTTIELAQKYGVKIGAHVAYPDKENFGRTNMYLPDNELYTLIQQQLHIMQMACTAAGANLYHVKPHGALYNQSAASYSLALLVAQAVKDFNNELVLLGLSNSCSVTAARPAGVKIWEEAFADRSYEANGSLTPRDIAGSVITDMPVFEQQAQLLLHQKQVITRQGTTIALNADTVCLHGDNPMAVNFARHLQSLITHSNNINNHQ